eukprot:4944642-Alexandrium_andersonii.AAC.1
MSAFPWQPSPPRSLLHLRSLTACTGRGQAAKPQHKLQEPRWPVGPLGNGEPWMSNRRAPTR